MLGTPPVFLLGYGDEGSVPHLDAVESVGNAIMALEYWVTEAAPLAAELPGVSVDILDRLDGSKREESPKRLSLLAAIGGHLMPITRHSSLDQAVRMSYLLLGTLNPHLQLVILPVHPAEDVLVIQEAPECSLLELLVGYSVDERRCAELTLGDRPFRVFKGPHFGSQ